MTKEKLIEILAWVLLVLVFAPAFLGMAEASDRYTVERSYYDRDDYEVKKNGRKQGDLERSYYDEDSYTYETDSEYRERERSRKEREDRGIW